MEVSAEVKSGGVAAGRSGPDAALLTLAQLRADVGRQGNELKDAAVGKAIDDAPARAPGVDQAYMFEEPEVSGDDRAVMAEDRHELADSLLAVREHQDETEPDRIAQRREQRRRAGNR